MLTLEPFDPVHLAAFVPGEPDRESYEMPNLPVMLAEYPTVTVVEDGKPFALLGVRPSGGALIAWSMWSEAARRHPFKLSRFLRLHTGWLLESYGKGAKATATNPAEQRLADWLALECATCPS